MLQRVSADFENCSTQFFSTTSMELLQFLTNCLQIFQIFAAFNQFLIKLLMNIERGFEYLYETCKIFKGFLTNFCISKQIFNWIFKNYYEFLTIFAVLYEFLIKFYQFLKNYEMNFWESSIVLTISDEIFFTNQSQIFSKLCRIQWIFDNIFEIFVMNLYTSSSQISKIVSEFRQISTDTIYFQPNC